MELSRCKEKCCSADAVENMFYAKTERGRCKKGSSLVVTHGGQTLGAQGG